MPIFCCVPGCNSKGKTRYHVFPVYDEQMFNIWVERAAHPNFKKGNLTDMQIRRNYKICDGHFIDECKVPGSKRLKYYSLPSVNVPGFHDEPTVKNSFFVDTFKEIVEATLNDHSYTSRLTETENEGLPRHRFPNPKTDLDRYYKWIEILENEQLRLLTPEYVYQNRRICSAHFADRYKSPGNPRLHRNALPFPGFSYHRFPNPKRYYSNFKRWLEILGIEKLWNMTPEKVYTNRRICFAHFESRFKSEGNPMLHRNAYPTLNLPGAQNIVSKSDSQKTIQLEPSQKRSKDMRCIHEKCITNTLPENEKPRFFSIPRNDDLRIQWLTKLNRSDLIYLTHGQLYDRSYRVCKLHFSSKQFQNDLELKLNFGQVPLDVLAEGTESATVNVKQDILSPSVVNTEINLKRPAPGVEQEVPLKQAKIECELNSSATQNVFVETNYLLQEAPSDDEEKISETIRRLELLKKNPRGINPLNKKMSEELGDLLTKAVAFDLKKNYHEAIIYYQKGIELLCRTLNNEVNEPKKIYLKNKIQEYLGRAEKIKELLKEYETNHEQIKIENGSTGHSYEKIFGRFLGPDVDTIKIEDPYIRIFYQCQNLLMFCELVVKSCANLKKIYLVTTQSLNINETIEQQKWLQELKESLLNYKVILDITYSSTLHDRQISFGNGWIVKIGRGLDYFKKSPGRFALGNTDYDLRQCNETTIDIFHQKTLKQSFG